MSSYYLILKIDIQDEIIMMYRTYFSLMFTFFFLSVAAQNNCNIATSYFEDGHYQIAQNMFLNQLSSVDNKDEVLYYIARCSDELSDGDRKYWYSLLIKEHDYSSYFQLAKKDLSFIYFSEKQYLMASILLSHITDSKIKDDEMYFKLAYSLFMIDSLDDAKYYFSQIKDKNGQYKSLSLYYYAHISYIQKLYKISLSNFQLLENDKVFASIVPYYITQIYFFQKQYSNLIDYAVPVLENVIPSREEEINRLIAESYYQLADFHNAERYFKNYISLSQDVRMVDYFQLGQINVFLEDYIEAIAYLEKVENVSDSLIQYNSYYLGKSYLKTNQKNFALQAFRKASNIDMDLDLKEESLYNYFKLCYELDLPYANLTDVIAQMDTFHLKRYKSEVKRLMINMFQSTNQYQEAFDFLKHNHLPEKEERETLQRLAYYIAVQHYNNANYNNALLMFEYSRKYPENKEIDVMCIYWLADCYFQLLDYRLSINKYKEFLEIPSNSLFIKIAVAKYNLAYSYFQSHQYNLSAEYFQKAIHSNLDELREHDSYLRMADSYYMMSDFENARKNYIKSSDNGSFDQDYALYQQSKCDALLSDYKSQEKILLEIERDFKNSPYIIKTLFDLANLYKNINRDEEALIYYDKVLRSSDDEEMISSSILNKGLIYFNNSEIEMAIELMKKIIIEYPKTKSFKSAKVGLKEAYLILGDINEYFDFINTIPEINISLAFKDSLVYQIALNNYQQENYLDAQSNFDSYLSTFGDQSIFFLSSSFYLAESYWKTKDTLKSIAGYKKILELGPSRYLESSIIQLSRYSYNIQDYTSSNIYYQKLDSIASSNHLKRESVISLMLGFEEINLETAVAYAKRVLNTDKIDNRLLARAKIIIARSDLKNGNYARSSDLCDEIIALTTNKDGSEAMYMKSYFTYLEEDYEKTEELIFLMAEKYSSNHWIAKGFILLSDVYVKLGNDYQAKSILESVIKNHDGEDIVNEAREKWERIVERDSQKIYIEKMDATIEIGDTLDYEINYNDLENKQE